MEGLSWPIKVKAGIGFGQRFADLVAKVIRSWTFVIIQMIFIVLWIGLNHYIPRIAWDNKAFDYLKLVLSIEASFIGSVLLMSQHYRSEKDRRIIFNDYILDLHIKKQLKEMRPMIEEIYKNIKK